MTYEARYVHGLCIDDDYNSLLEKLWEQTKLDGGALP